MMNQHRESNIPSTILWLRAAGRWENKETWLDKLGCLYLFRNKLVRVHTGEYVKVVWNQVNIT